MTARHPIPEAAIEYHVAPAHPQWFRDVRDQCSDAGVPYVLKNVESFRRIPPAECSRAITRKTRPYRRANKILCVPARDEEG
jgi:hypothetical protein